MVKNLPANAGDIRNAGVIPGWEDPQRRAWQLTPIFLTGESHEQRSLVSYSPWDHKELDMTQQLTLFALNDFIQAIFIIVEDIHIKLNSQAYS